MKPLLIAMPGHDELARRLAVALPADDGEIISRADLAQSRLSMNLNELKAKPIHELVKVADSMGLESLARSRKQDIIFLSNPK